jgi:hypothetical protein
VHPAADRLKAVDLRASHVVVLGVGERLLGIGRTHESSEVLMLCVDRAVRVVHGTIA